MEIRHVIDGSKNTKTVYMEKVYFKSTDIVRYNEMFQQLRAIKVIEQDCRFEDHVWYIYDFISNKYEMLKFDIDIYANLQIALKCFVTAQLTIGKRSDTLMRNVRFIKGIIYSTNGLMDSELYKNYISVLEKNDTRKCQIATGALVNFLLFYNTKNAKEFIDISASVAKKRTKSRDLPDFQKVLLFDSIVNRYFNNFNKEDHFKYKAIQLWWSITNIIPMRPTEFLLLEFDCITKKDDNTFSIKVPRIKNYPDDAFIDMKSLRYQSFQISQEVFALVSDFKLKLLQENLESSFLFSYDYYKHFFKTKPPKYSNLIENRMNTNHFRNLLQKFYKYAVEDIFNERFEDKIIPAHTRHFSIINLFLQGFNLLTIAEMSGHLDVRTAEHYYSHAKSFVQSYVYNFVTTSLGNTISKKMSDGFIGWRRDVIDKGKSLQHTPNHNFLPVDFGFCKDINFPNNCGEHCGPCPHFIFQPAVQDYNKAISWLENYSEQLNRNIELAFEIMIETSKALISTFTPTKDETLRSHGRQLQAYLDHKINTDFLLINLKEEK